LVGFYSRNAELYVVAAVLFAVKGVIIPSSLKRLEAYVDAKRESQPYVNVASSLIGAGLLLLLAYVITRPLVQASTLPTRGGLPLAMGLIFVGLFVLITRKKALTQVVGFLILENGIALMAILGTYGTPFIVELGVFLDVLMGFLVMQIFIYQIQDTFESIDVEHLRRLRH